MSLLMEGEFLWIDSDAGTDDAVAIMFAMKYARLLGVSCIYGNTSCSNVVRNVGRIFDVMRAQFPDLEVPVLSISCEKCPNESNIRQNDEVIWFHGEDGLGDVPDFENEHEIKPNNYELTDFMTEVARAAEIAKSHGKPLKFLAIGPLTSLLMVKNIENVQFYAMAGAIPEYANEPITQRSCGNMEEFQCPKCEHNVGCDVKSAKEAFDEIEITLADWSMCLACQYNVEDICGLKSNLAGEFVKQFTGFAVKTPAARQTIIICDLLAAYAAIFGDKCHFNDCNVSVITTDGSDRGRTVGREGNRCHVICSVDMEFLENKLTKMFSADSNVK